MVRVIAVVAAALSVAALTAVPAYAHEGDPDYESLVTSSGPEGLEVRVLSGDDRLEVRNRTGEIVVIEGYDDEPYARLFPDGRVQVNQRSPATYLNEDPRGDVDVPGVADAEAEPRWRTVEGNGRFEFHDHRIHWMNDADPPKVREDPSARQKVYDWTVPVTVAGAPATIDGSLWWRGTGGGTPTAAFVVLGVVIVGGLALIVVVRRRRGSRDGDDAPTPPKAEAW